MSEKIRQAVVAGTFYPDDSEVLRKELSERIEIKKDKESPIVLISPHAGYYYSGSCAGKGFGSINIPDRVIILGVDHRGSAYPYAIDGHDKWDMPMGQVQVDFKLRDKLIEKSKIFKIDTNSGLDEHSIEVQIPFLQYLNPKVKILPILISGTNYDELQQGGVELAELTKNTEDDILIVASTDMSHYISSEEAKKKDNFAIEKIEALSPKELLNTVINERISMCGVLPVVMSLVLAKELGAEETKIIEYTNSGNISGDYDQVVGYLSMMLL